MNCNYLQMNYKISFFEMNRLAEKNLSAKSAYSLNEMKLQVKSLRKASIAKNKKKRNQKSKE